MSKKTPSLNVSLISKVTSLSEEQVIDRIESLASAQEDCNDVIYKKSGDIEIKGDILVAFISECSKGNISAILGSWLPDAFSKANKKRAKKRAKKRDGYTGTVGVTAVKMSSGNTSWSANINKDGKRYYLGSFKTYEEARAVRLEAEERLGVKRN